jgi:hypothetical protein
MFIAVLMAFVNALPVLQLLTAGSSLAVEIFGGGLCLGGEKADRRRHSLRHGNAIEASPHRS